MYIGIDIGGTKCAVIKADGAGSILEKKAFPTTSFDKTLSKILNITDELIGNEKISAIGVSCGGPLDAKRGVIMSPPNLPGWDDVHITEILEKKYKVKAYLQNDANACALAEWKFGAGKGKENLVFLTFGTGLGAGLILNGRLYDGTCGMAGEIGHIRLEAFGPVGYGKSGSFEGFCSGNGIAQLGKLKANELLQMGKSASFCKNAYELDNITAKLIAECADNGFEDAKDVYRICGKYLGKGLSVIIDILNPEIIVIGSVFARSGHLLTEAMKETMEKECLPTSFSACKVVPAALGEEIGDYAAVSVAENGYTEDKNND